MTVTWRRPVPSAFTMKMSNMPRGDVSVFETNLSDRFEMNAIRDPSGEMTGKLSAIRFAASTPVAVSNVRCCTLVPSAFIV